MLSPECRHSQHLCLSMVFGIKLSDTSGRSCWGVLKYHFWCSWMLWDAFQLCLSIISQVFGCFGNIFHFPLCLCLLPGLRHSFWEGPAFPINPRLNDLKLFSSPASTSCLPRASDLCFHTHLGPRFWFSHPSPYPLPVTHRSADFPSPWAIESHETTSSFFLIFTAEKTESQRKCIVSAVCRQ